VRIKNRPMSFAKSRFNPARHKTKCDIGKQK
jgi:hypothetical protein